MARRRMEVEQGLRCAHVMEWASVCDKSHDAEIGRGQRAVAVGEEDGDDHIEGGVADEVAERSYRPCWPASATQPHHPVLIAARAVLFGRVAASSAATCASNRPPRRKPCSSI